MGKCLFFDADGTILDIVKGTPEDTKLALQQLRKNGHAFVKCYCIYFLKKFQFFNFIQFSFKIMQIFYCARSQSVLNYIVVATSTKPLNFSSFKGSF